MGMPPRTIGLILLLALAALVPLKAQAADDEVTVYKRAVEKSFAAWLESLWPDAEAAGVSRKIFDWNNPLSQFFRGIERAESLQLSLGRQRGDDGVLEAAQHDA